MSSGLIHFYDAASPQNVPSGVHAAVYVNGFVWSEEEIRRMRRCFRISVLRESHWAKIARCIDVEAGAATWEDAVAYCHARHALTGRHDFTVYANLSTLENFDGQGNSAVKVLRERAPGLPFRLWVADWDNNPGNRPVIDGIAAWAKQYQGGVSARYDVSALYGVDDLIPTH